jgi:hypothetical protein
MQCTKGITKTFVKMLQHYPTKTKVLGLYENKMKMGL